MRLRREGAGVGWVEIRQDKGHGPLRAGVDGRDSARPGTAGANGLLRRHDDYDEDHERQNSPMSAFGFHGSNVHRFGPQGNGRLQVAGCK